jgi:hypothetical protein
MNEKIYVCDRRDYPLGDMVSRPDNGCVGEGKQKGAEQAVGTRLYAYV